MENELNYNTLIPENIPNERKSALKTLGYYFLIFIVGLNLLLLIAAIWGMVFVTIADINISEHQFNQLLNTVSVYADPLFGVLSLWWLFYYTKKKGLLTLRRININVFDIVIILAGYAVLIASSQLLDIVFKHFHYSIATPDNQKVVEDLLRTNPIIMIISAVILAPIKEEWITRKLIIGSIFKNSPILGLIVSSFGFGLLHMIAGFSIYALLSYSLAGLIFGIIYIRTKKIEVTILAHFLNNLVSILAFYFVK
ncbi:CPBP family intramembrane glutamic endopeptidase [Gottfriedia luciferensis]|uniref:CPBP family intramembrane glutamic endopeptidase n=1 Tax=Gottfriedia luciferensis TaxID=178774 RepID=UPI000B443DEF|nr:type II CAAX endopeptidase family protein [Gottfriedia luciferensis]